MTRSTACACAAVVSVWAGAANGQTCEPGWGEGFPNALPLNGDVRAVVVFDDGSGPSVYIGGTFTLVGTQPVRGIARWQDDRWVEVGGISGNPGSSSAVGVYSLTVLDTSTGPALYAGGVFTNAGGTPAVGIARWDGRSWSALGAGLNNQVRALAIFDHGGGPALYAAGAFTASGSTPVRGLARWDGAQWHEVGGGLGPGGVGYALGVFDLGAGPRLHVGGRFTISAGSTAQNIAAWDGAAWHTFGPGLFSGDLGVLRMLVFDHGFGPELTVGGGFGLASSPPQRPRVARWTGTSWMQVGSELSAIPSHYVNSMLAFPGPAGPVLHVGGWFSGATWLNAVNYTARLANGDWVGLAGGMTGIVRCMTPAVVNGTPVIYASGSFTMAGQAIANRVAKWDAVEWHAIDPWRGLTTSQLSPGQGMVACTFDDGSGERVFVGGSFIGAGGRQCNSIAAWDGVAWWALGTGLQRSSGAAPATVSALAPFDDGTGLALYAAGNFDRAGGSPCAGIASWDGALWTPPGGTGLWVVTASGAAAGAGYALRDFDDGSGPAMYVSGDFDYAGSTPARGIARWNGAAWAGVGTGGGVPSNSVIRSLEVFDEGAGPRLFVGGVFPMVNGVNAHAIARWDGEAWTGVGGGFPNAPPESPAAINDLAVLDHGGGPALIAAGHCAAVPGAVSAALIARWDGQSWTMLTPGAGITPLGGDVARVWTFDDGEGPAIYIGGAMHVSGHNPPTGLLRLRAGVWELPRGGAAHSSAPTGVAVRGAAALHDGDRDRLLITGWFDVAGGIASLGIAEWTGCPGCRADCNRDGSLTAADFGCFQTRFAAADPWADCSNDGALTVQDFGCFQTLYMQGCP